MAGKQDKGTLRREVAQGQRQADARGRVQRTEYEAMVDAIARSIVDRIFPPPSPGMVPQEQVLQSLVGVDSSRMQTGRTPESFGTGNTQELPGKRLLAVQRMREGQPKKKRG